MPVVRSSFSEADTRDLVFLVLAQFADGLRERPTLYTIYDEIGLLPGEFAPAWVRRIYFDAVTRRVVETAVEFLRRIGAPPPNPYTADDQETLMAAERGRRAIADPSDERADAVGRAQSRAAREYWIGLAA